MIDILQNSFATLFAFSPDNPWLFTQFTFWVFFAIVIGIYSFFYKKVRIRNIYLLIISLFFYYKTGGWFCILLLFSCISNYSWGLLIGLIRKKYLKIAGLVGGLIMNVGLLVYFKYAYFFTDVLNQLTNDSFETYDWLAEIWNSISNSHINTSEIILPIGISFFTFQAISYLVDVYKGRTLVVRNVFDFSFYLSFFPQLVAGPIVRASAFIPQLYKPYVISKQEFGHAVFLILTGLVKKIVVSDYLALNFIDRIFEQPGSYAGIENLSAIYAYALQIYCDFSGYTDIAIGLALMLGFKLPINFNSPYKAVSLSDFWHRWHISLSTWMRDYLYIPLGGNRKGKIRTHINLMLTMLLGGLWHGANLKFVIWGGLHGFALVVEKVLSQFRIKLPQTKWSRIVSVFFTFHLVCFAWIFFRAKSIENVREILNQIFYSFQLHLIDDLILAYPKVFAILFIGFIVHWLPIRWQELVRGKFINLPIWTKGIVALLVLLVLKAFLNSDIQPFIYFRF
jgi:alginate O-acetyltransferase complex protein AlgI